MGEIKKHTQYMESQIIIPAEQLSAGVATAAMRSTNTRRKPAGVFCSAWNHVEYAMSDNDSVDDDIRIDYFDYAQDLLGEVIVRPDSNQDVRFAALRLSSYVSVFRKRRLGEDVTSSDCQELYHSIGAALALLRPLELDEPPQSIMIEAGCEALSARSLRPENLLYPTSPREEASPFSHLNHDSYFYVNDDKMPLQQKLIATTKSYDEAIRVLTLLPLLEKAAKKSNLVLPESSSEQLNMLLGLIVSETHQVDINRHEKQFLDYLTRSIIAHKRPTARLTAA